MVYLPTAVEGSQPCSKIDLSHHLSKETQERGPNPIKTIWKIAHGKQGTINMGNGDPHSMLYPLSKMDFVVPSMDEPDPVQAWRTGNGKIKTITSYKDDACTLSLKTAFAYGTGAGLQEVRKLLTTLNDRIHSPPNHVVSLSLGNADSLTKCFRLFGNPGDVFLCEEFTFSPMTNAASPLGIKWAPIKMDKDGLIPTDMERIIVNWDETSQGKRPHVLYTIPCSQNPTGSTLPIERRKEIYEIARKWDIVILEDDPYYLLQYDLDIDQSIVGTYGFTEAMARVLPVSFLSMDYDGRVIRLDSFSKVVAPGMRLGWVTASSFFAEKLDMLTDSSSQHPHGFGQVFIAELLGEQGWGLDGFMKWAKSLCDEYQRRRDLFMEIFAREVSGAGFASAEVPKSGMFVWIKIHLEQHASYYRVTRAPGDGPSTNTVELMNKLFLLLLDSGLVLIPAHTFAIAGCLAQSECGHVFDHANYFRATFVGTDDTIRDGLNIFARTVEEFFRY